MGTVVGIATAGLALPALAASLVGGAGGYQWAKREGRKEMSRHKKKGGDDMPAGDLNSPTLRRLKYLVKWGHWQLLEYEDGAPESRCLVIDEVVRAFSQWVQKLYLLRARGHAGEDSSEAWEVLLHLAPLYYFLQRRATLEAVVKSAELLTAAFDRGTPNSSCADRCQVIFPTILETISVLDRLSSATHAQLQRETTSSSRRGEVEDISRAHRRLRLRRIVDSLRKALEREDVQQALADRRLFVEHKVPALSEGEAGETPSSGRSSPREGMELMVPPEGVENEPGGATFSDDDVDAYYSMSDSDDEAGRKEAGAASSRQPSTKQPQANDRPTLGIAQRIEAYRRGLPFHSWDVFDESNFQVRSPTYIRDKKKCPSGPSLLDLVNVDSFVIGPEGPVYNVSDHPAFYPHYHREVLKDPRMLFVQNWVFPPFQSIITGAVDPEAAWYKDTNSPQRKLWDAFLEMGEARKELFKVISSIEVGPWLVRRAVPKKPVLVGRKVQTWSYYKPDQYVELDFNVASSSTDAMAVSIVSRAFKNVQFVTAVLLEAREEEHLPEQLLLAPILLHADPARFPYPDLGSKGPGGGAAAAGS